MISTKPLMKKRIILSSVAAIAICGAFAFSAPASAQEAVATQPTVPQSIRQLIVEGNQRVESETILAYVAISPGDPFDPERIDLSLKSLFATGFFSDVQFEQRGAALVVKVVENPTINQVIFEGQKSLTTEKLEKEVQIKPRAWFSVGRVQADKKRLVEVYRRAGNFAAVISPKIKEQPQNRVDLIFEIEEGPKTGIRNIDFIGNKAYSERQLKGVIVTEESKWWRFFSSKDNYDPDKMEYDREQLSKFYLNSGYYDFKINSAVAELSPDQKDFFVTFSMDEGEKYRVGEIKVNAQLERLSPEILKSVVPIKTGAVYNRDSIEKAIEAITFAAGAAGYAFVDVRPMEVPDRENRTVGLTFEVDEGPRVYIERIDIIGNTATLDHVIRRELRLSEGDAFNRVLLDSSKNRIKALGFFKDVTVEDRRTSLPDRTVVEVKLEEQSTGELAFSLGYSSAEAYQFDVSITQRNLRGRGQFLRFRVAASSYSKNVDIRFTEPRFLGRNLAAGIDIFSVQTDYSNYGGFSNAGGFLQTSSGVGLRVGFPVAEDRNLGLHYTYRVDSIEFPLQDCSVLNVNRSASCDYVGDFVTSLAGYSFNWDRRNDPIKPTRGFVFNINQEIAGIGDGVQYHKSELAAAVYRGIFPGWVLSAKTTAGYIDGWGGDNIRINDRFFKGGQTFRGFDLAGLGPRPILSTVTLDPTDPTKVLPGVETAYGDPLGGKAYAIGTLELSVPTPLPESYGISSALFVDFGSVGLLDKIDKTFADQTFTEGTDTRVTNINVRDGLSLRAAAGLSVFWTSPFGPVRFDFAYPIVNEKYDRTKSFRFSTSTAF